jgi:hypothetical protein
VNAVASVGPVAVIFAPVTGTPPAVFTDPAMVAVAPGTVADVSARAGTPLSALSTTKERSDARMHRTTDVRFMLEA